MSTQKNLITLCFATVFTLGLAACGGGGGGDAPVTGMTDDTMVPTMVVPTIVGEVIPSGTTFMLPAGLVANITVSDVEEGTSVTVPGFGMFECVTGPCTVVVADNVVTTTGDIEVVSLADDLPAEVLMALASAIAPAGPTPATPEQKTAAAATKVTAITAEADQTTNAGIGGSVENVDDITYSLAIARDSDGTTVTIADTAMGEDDDPKFAQVMDFADGRTMHVRVNSDDEDGKVEEVVIVKTDIGDPTPTPFGDEHMLDTNNNTAEPPVFQSLIVNTGNVGMWSSSEFPSTPGTTRTYPEDVEATEDENEGAIDGKFDGADGTFVCASSGCSIGTDEDGKLDMVGGTWRFTPADGAMVDVADADYLHYGFWLMRTTDADGATTYNEVETFAGSSIAATSSVADVEGSATYEGGAVGVYVKNVFDSEGAIDTATSGHFNADVALTAYFGGDEVPVSKQDSLTGTIDNFVLSGGEENAWSVALKSDDDTATGTETGTANGGGAEGSFSATFHGLTPLTEAEDDDNATVAPGAVVGEFNANFSNGTVAGGFGARKQ